MQGGENQGKWHYKKAGNSSMWQFLWHSWPLLSVNEWMRRNLKDSARSHHIVIQSSESNYIMQLASISETCYCLWLRLNSLTGICVCVFSFFQQPGWKFKEEIIPIPYKIFQKIETDGICPNLFYEAHITLKPKPDKDIIRKVQINNFHEYRCKNLQQNINKLNSTIHKKNYTPQPTGIYARCARLVQHLKKIN